MKKKPASKIFSFILTAALMLGVFVMPPQTAYAAMPTSAAGQPYDGVDFAAMMAPGSGIYYGTYDHATALSSTQYGSVTAKESDGSGPTSTPILWRVMGEENGDGRITVMSEYVLDSQQFDASSNMWGTSSINTWLNGTFLSGSFLPAESDFITAPQTITTKFQDGSSTGHAITPTKLWLPATNNWTNNSGAGDVSWHSDLTNTPEVSIGSQSDNMAYLKGDTTQSTPIYWWLRSPYSDFSYFALCVGSVGYVSYDYVGDTLGVRPAFKLNPESVIFTSEILSSSTTPQYAGQAWATEADGTNYAAASAAAAKNFKLTVVDNSLTLTGLQDSGSNNITSSTALTATPGGTVALTGTGDSGTNLTYKIIADNGGTREIVGYGQSADNTSLTVNAKDLNGANLADGDYTVYVWAQKNNTINSHEGSAPQYFTLDVQAGGTPPTDFSVTYAAGGATGGSVPVDPSSPYPSGSSVTVLGNTGGLYRTDYTFAGWRHSADGQTYTAGQLFVITGNVTLTAQWNYNGGSYTGGDSSDNYTPPVIWNIETDKQPNLPKTATLSHSGTVKNNRLNFTITKEMVQAALDKAGKDPDGIGLIFDITGGGFTAQTITFEDTAIDLLKSSGVKFVQVHTGMFRFKFDDKAIAQLDAQTTGHVAVNANPAKLNAEAKKLIGSRPAFDVTVQFKKDGKTWNVVSFGSGKMTRWIAYKLAAGENAGNLAAVYVDKNGKVSWIDDSSYDNGWLGWTGNTCSVYGVGYKTPAPAFTDTESHWARDYIDFAVSRGYMSGTSNTTFAPNTVITRGMFITALGRLSGVDMSGYKTSSFSDVAADSYYLPYIEWAVTNKIVNGVGGGRFAPESPIAREDMAVMMSNFAKALNYKLPVALEAFKFTDAGSVAAHAKEAVTAVQQAGIIVGKSGGAFDPKGSLTRAEAATVQRRFVETVIDPAYARGWIQNDSGGWMYYGITTGKLLTGWQDIGGDKYYFDADGVMQAGKWMQIEGKRYYFYPDGKLAVNTTIDGYTIGADGARE